MPMPGAVGMAAASVIDPVEPQSLKKLSLKSLKRALDLFSPIHGHPPPPDPESKRIRISYKLNAEYGLVKNLLNEQAHEQGRDNAQGHGDQAPTSTALALPGDQESRDPQREGGQNALVSAPTMLPRGLDAGNPSRNVAGAIVSIPGSTERHYSSSALVERIPSRWPRPTWHAPWKNYRVISGHLGWVRSIAFDPSNSWFCTGSADPNNKGIKHGRFDYSSSNMYVGGNEKM